MLKAHKDNLHEWFGDFIAKKMVPIENDSTNLMITLMDGVENEVEDEETFNIIKANVLNYLKTSTYNLRNVTACTVQDEDSILLTTSSTWNKIPKSVFNYQLEIGIHSPPITSTLPIHITSVGFGGSKIYIHEHADTPFDWIRKGE